MWDNRASQIYRKIGTLPPKPDRILLLAQVRRATIQDQKALLEWLLKKFNLEAHKKEPRR